MRLQRESWQGRWEWCRVGVNKRVEWSWWDRETEARAGKREEGESVRPRQGWRARREIQLLAREEKDRNWGTILHESESGCNELVRVWVKTNLHTTYFEIYTKTKTLVEYIPSCPSFGAIFRISTCLLAKSEYWTECTRF